MTIDPRNFYLKGIWKTTLLPWVLTLLKIEDTFNQNLVVLSRQNDNESSQAPGFGPLMNLVKISALFCG